MQETEAWDEHGQMKKLCALAQGNSLSIGEHLELRLHLKSCPSCRDIYEEYCAISEKGMAALAADGNLPAEARRWDNSAARARLQASICNEDQHRLVSMKAAPPYRGWSVIQSTSRKALAIASLAACAVIALTFGAYRMGQQKVVILPQQSPLQSLTKQSSAPQTSALGGALATEDAQISRLEKQIANEQLELVKLRTASSAAEQRVTELGATNGQREADLRNLIAERDQLASRLAEKEKSFEILQADYSNLRAEHDRALLHTASLEAEVTDLQAVHREQENRLKDDEQYLTSDRDIRELMGARKLYIADVFDVDSVSRTKKPFGRVFYTQNKSLVFYAFDLDHQPGVKNASVFQVWGQRDAEITGAPHAMNLGILYMDSETNRRWVLRSDDPKQLAEIDAVFVTVEPHGGSQKPTGKPLLYALLRKEANHP